MNSGSTPRRGASDFVQHHASTEANTAAASRTLRVRRHPGDVFFDDLAVEKQQRIARGWAMDLLGASQEFDGLRSDADRWHVMCSSEKADGSYEAVESLIKVNADQATSAAWDADIAHSGPDGGCKATRLLLTPASSIAIKPVHWLWDNRVPLGELTLLAGREGIGKSAIAYTLAASVTTGVLEGKYLGEPRSVVVAATEDSWECTIVPRLIAAGADLDRVFRIDVVAESGMGGSLTLPSDIVELREAVESVNAVMVLLDPLMSRLSTHLDSHKDAEVRVALEPLKAFATDACVAVLCIIHVNKSSNADPLTVIMGSRAFTAVPRAALFAVKHPEDDGTCLLGFEKNNLGPRDETTYKYRIVGTKVADTHEGPVWTGRVEWLGESDRSVKDVMEAMSVGGMETMTAVDDAAGWLEDYLASAGGWMV